MTTYNLIVRQIPRNNWRWVIEGLEANDSFPEKHATPDTTLWLVGMYHSLDTIENMMQAVYSTLYDELQVNEAIKDGDRFESKELQVSSGLSYENRVMVTIPAMSFVVRGCHLVKE